MRQSQADKSGVVLKTHIVKFQRLRAGNNEFRTVLFHEGIDVEVSAINPQFSIFESCNFAKVSVSSSSLK
jgi:hypothetical protein